MSINSTLPLAYNLLDILSNSKVSAFIRIPSLVLIVPLFNPLTIFPLFKISTSVTSKLNCSMLFALDQIKKFEKNIKSKYKILFFINVFEHEPI